MEPSNSTQVNGGTGCDDLTRHQLGQQGNIGIEGTPVIDPATGVMYFVAAVIPTDGGLSQTYWLHAVDIRNGNECTTSAPCGSVGGSPKQVTTSGFNELYQQQRTALALASGNVYVDFGSYCDQFPDGGMYHGYLFAYSATSLALVQVFNSTPTITSTAQCDAGEAQCGAGIWQIGAGPAIDDAGNLYVSTGNGRYDGTNFGDSVVKLSPTLGFDAATSSYFTPQNHMALEGNDWDLGVAGPALFPGDAGPNLVQADKEGIVYLLSQGNLGGVGTNCGSCSASCTPPCLDAGGNPTANTLGQTVLWTNPEGGLNMYVWGGPVGLETYQYSGSTFRATPAYIGGSVTDGGGWMSLSANGSTAGSGVLWGITVVGRGANRAMYAFNAETLAVLWSVSIGQVSNFTPPLVANGAVYVRGPDTSDTSGYVQGYTFPCTRANPYDPNCDLCKGTCSHGWSENCCGCKLGCASGFYWEDSCCICCKVGNICCSQPPP